MGQIFLENAKQFITPYVPSIRRPYVSTSCCSYIDEERKKGEYTFVKTFVLSKLLLQKVHCGGNSYFITDPKN